MDEIKYEDFCKETGCMHYNLIKRLTSILNSSQSSNATERDLGIARVHCRQNCQRTAYQFANWLKEKGLVGITFED